MSYDPHPQRRPPLKPLYAVLFGVGAIIGWGLHRWNQDRLDRRHSAMSPTEGATAVS